MCVRHGLCEDFHDLGWIPYVHDSFLTTLRHGADFLHGWLFNHFADYDVFRSVGLVVTQLGSGLQHEVHCDFCVATFLSKLLISFLLEIFNSAFLNIFCFLQVSENLFTVPLKFCLSFLTVFGKKLFHVQFSQRFNFDFFFTGSILQLPRALL